MFGSSPAGGRLISSAEKKDTPTEKPKVNTPYKRTLLTISRDPSRCEYNTYLVAMGIILSVGVVMWGIASDVHVAHFQRAGKALALSAITGLSTLLFYMVLRGARIIDIKTK